MTRIPIHPGVTLKQDFLEPLELSANRLAAAIKVPQNRISAIVNASRGISADTAMRLERYFGVSAGFWMNLQARYELDLAEESSDGKLQDNTAYNYHCHKV
jgi:addiction module HigA family antidote